MRRTLTLFVSVLLIVTAFFVFAFFGAISLGEPVLTTELGPDTPWHARPGNSFEVSIQVVNKAWPFAAAKDVKVEIVAPQGFTISPTKFSEHDFTLGTVRGGEVQNHTLTMMVGNGVLPGNYTITIKVLGSNFSEKTLTPQVVIELPLSHGSSS